MEPRSARTYRTRTRRIALVLVGVIVAASTRTNAIGAGMKRPDPAQVLSGTIHGRNRGALSAATHAGRQDVGGWWWAPLP